MIGMEDEGSVALYAILPYNVTSERGRVVDVRCDCENSCGNFMRRVYLCHWMRLLI